MEEQENFSLILERRFKDIKEKENLKDKEKFEKIVENWKSNNNLALFGV
jgi:hypothetical protein